MRKFLDCYTQNHRKPFNCNEFQQHAVPRKIKNFRLRRAVQIKKNTVFEIFVV